MKKLLIVVFGMAYLGTFAQPFPPVKVEDCPAVNGTINIDGVDDESSWSEVQEFTIFNLSNEGDWEGSSDLDVHMKFAWDNENLYIFVDIADDIEHNWNGTDGGPWEFDCIELFLQLDTITNPSTYTESTLQYRFNRGDVAWESMGSWIRNGITTDDLEALTHWENTADGWVVEAAIPWLSCMPEGYMTEDVMDYIDGFVGFEMIITDSDGSDPLIGAWDSGTQAAWDEDGEEGDTADGTEYAAWNNTSVFGYLVLAGAVEPPPPANEPPVPDAGPNQTVDEHTVVYLDATGSYDPEGEPLTYTWDPPGGIALSDIYSATPSFSAPEVHKDEDFIIYLKVDDGESSPRTDYVVVQVQNLNKPPVADAGSDRIVNEREMVQLSGGASYDPDIYDELSYQWTSLQGVSMIGSNTIEPLLNAPEVYEDKSYQFILEVNDGEFSAMDTMDLWVNSLFDKYDTLVVYDTVYVVEQVFNTIMISIVDDQDNLIAREKDGELYVKLFPNPADQYINIHSDMTISEIEIVNVQGNVVLHEMVNALVAELNLGGFSAGNYFLRINTESGLVIKQLVLE